MAQEVIDRIPSFRLRLLHSTAASLFISGDGTVSNAGGRRTKADRRDRLSAWSGPQQQSEV